jgi:1,4-dihydroxy-2-naphthoate octaprenyltransferase
MKQHDSQLSLWWLAIRPRTLPAAAAPVAVGSAVAIHDGLFTLLPALAAFGGALLLQIAVNLANDYFDAKNAIDSEARLGPVRVTQSGLIAPGRVKGAMILCLAVAALIFLYMTRVGGLPIFLVGAASVLAALAYSGGPYPLASHGLGELFVFIFFGLVAVCGTYWVQAVSLSWLVVACSLPPGFLITAIMVVNNLRDRSTDAGAGKRTLAVRVGEARTIRLYRGLIVLSYLIVLLLAGFSVDPALLLPIATLPIARSLWREIRSATGADLNETLARTAKFSLFFSLLFAIGLAI